LTKRDILTTTVPIRSFSRIICVVERGAYTFNCNIRSFSFPMDVQIQDFVLIQLILYDP